LTLFVTFCGLPIHFLKQDLKVKQVFQVAIIKQIRMELPTRELLKL